MNLKIWLISLVIFAHSACFSQQDSFFKTVKPLNQAPTKSPSSISAPVESMESMLNNIFNPKLLEQLNSLGSDMISNMTKLMNDPEVVKSINTLNEKFAKSMNGFGQADSLMNKLIPKNFKDQKSPPIESAIDSMINKRGK